jgi:hypothetical protein
MKREHLKDKINELETSSNNKNIIVLHKDINEWRKGYQPIINSIKDENAIVLADTKNNFNKSKNYFVSY